MTRCQTKAIEKLKENKASKEELKIADQYFDYKKMDKEGMLLTPEEQDFMSQIEEVSEIKRTTKRVDEAMTSLSSDQVQSLNDKEPSYKGRAVVVVNGKANAKGDGELVIRDVKKGFFRTVKGSEVVLEKSSTKDVLRYGNEPDGEVSGDHVKVIEEGKINSLEEHMKLFDKLVEGDGSNKIVTKTTLKPTEEEIEQELKAKLVGKKVELWGGRNGSEAEAIGKATVADIKYVNKTFSVQFKDSTSWGTYDGLGKLREIDGEIDPDGYTRVMAFGNVVPDAISDIRRRKETEETSYIDNSAHTEELRGILKNLVGGPIRAIPEMAVYLNEKASVNTGEMKNDGVYIDLNRDRRKMSGEMSAAEVYVHEMVHAASVFAINMMKDKVPHELHRLKKIRREMMKVVKPEDLMPDAVMNKEVEEKLAKDRWDYIFTGKNGLEEFLAYALTNEKLRDKLKDVKIYKDKKPEGVLNLVVYYLKKLFDMAMMRWRQEDRNTTADKAIENIMNGFMNAQAEAQDVGKKASVYSKIEEKVDEWENKAYEWQQKVASKMEDKALAMKPATGGRVEKAKYVATMVGQMLINSRTDGAVEAVLSSIGLKPEGIIQNTINTIKEGDSLKDTMQKLGLASLQVDQQREITATQIEMLAGELFKGKLSKKDRKALQLGVLQNDLGVLIAKYDNVKDMVNNDEVIDEKITKKYEELDKISNEREMRFYKFQIEGLAKYMIDGVGNELQLRNATAIAKMLGTSVSKKEVNSKVVELVDEIVSMEALKKTDKSVRDKVAEVMEEDFEGVKAYAMLQKGLEKYLHERRSGEDQLNERKGYIRETYDKYVTSTVEPYKDRKTMEKKGYKLVRKVDRSKYDLLGVEMALYVSTDMIRQPFNRTAVRYTGEKQQGMTIFDRAIKAGHKNPVKVAKESVAVLKKGTVLKNEAIMQGKNPKIEGMVMPEFKENGSVMDYRYPVSTKDKIEVLGLEPDGLHAVGRGYAHQVDVEESEKLNGTVWEEMMMDSAKHKGKYGKDIVSGKEYVKIDVSSDIESVRDIARILPPSFKEKLNKAKRDAIDSDVVAIGVAKELVGDGWKNLNDKQKMRIREQLAKGELWVRRDMLLNTFGFRDVSVANLPLVKELPVLIKTLIRKIENGWKEFVGLYKVDVVIKTIPVIIGNIVSNFIYALATGGNPFEVMNDMLVSWKELNEYMAGKDRLARIMAEYARTGDKKLLEEKARIENDMENSPIKPLIDAGLYTQIMEEIDTANFQSSNRITGYLDDKMENWPEMVKTGAHWMYVTEKTGLFQMVHKATAMSDFTARYAQYNQIMKKQDKKFRKKYGRGMSKDEQKKVGDKALSEIRDAFINYAQPDAAWMQYMNDMGLMLFTKYAVRIQRIITELYQKHPIRALGALVGQEITVGALDWDPDDITEKYIMFNGPTGIFYSPDASNMMMDILTPQLVDTLDLVLPIQQAMKAA